jgi:hypothetical protein
VNVDFLFGDLPLLNCSDTLEGHGLEYETEITNVQTLVGRPLFVFLHKRPNPAYVAALRSLVLECYPT